MKKRELKAMMRGELEAMKKESAGYHDEGVSYRP
jgi:hypothetical protein